MGVIEDPQVKELVEKFEHPSLIKSYEVDSVIVDDPLLDIKLSADQLMKTLVAGNYNAAPSTLSGGSALQTEDRTLRNRVKAAVRDWDRTRPLKETIKAALPEISDQYVDHFVDLAEELALKKGMTPPVRIGPQHTTNRNQDEAQKKLIDGLYLDDSKPFKVSNPLEMNRFKLYKLKNDAGQDVLVKEPNLSGVEGTEGAKNASAYYSVAKNVFGLGDHVPATNHFVHPKGLTGKDQAQHWQAQEFLTGSKPATGSAYEKAVKRGREQGWLHKLVAMDMILGHGDRHMGNVLVKDGKLMHIDNDDAFMYDGVMPHGSFGSKLKSKSDVSEETLPAETQEWLRSIDPRVLAQHMTREGISYPKVRSALFALKYMQQNGGRQNMKAINDVIYEQAQHLHAQPNPIEDIAG